MSKNLEPLNASFTAFSSPEKDRDLNECGICSKTFKTKVKLRRHLNLHNEYICRTCSQSFETNRELERPQGNKELRYIPLLNLWDIIQPTFWSKCTHQVAP